MDHKFQLITPLDHPCYSGHFPGQPIAPGVLLLDLVVASLGRGAPRAINQVKFHRAVRPGESFVLRVSDAGAKVGFRCELADSTLIAEGVLGFAQ